MDPNFNAVLSLRNVVKSVEPLNDARELVNFFRRAFSRLRNGRGGPVIVELPSDIWNEEVPEPLDYRPVLTARTAPHPADMGQAAVLLAEAKRPVIYARAWPQLRRLAELLAIPVTTSPEGKSAFPEDHPLALGSGGNAIPRPCGTSWTTWT